MLDLARSDYRAPRTIWFYLLALAAILILCAVSIACFRYLAGESPFSFFGEGATRNRYQNVTTLTLIQGISVALFMVLGIISGSIFDQIKRRSGPVKIISEARIALTKAHFYRAMLASPILFFAICTVSGQETNLLVSLMFAFQNGFFCDTILRGFH
jgi:hypothetical protein